MFLTMLIPLVLAAQAPQGDATLKTEHLTVTMTAKAGWTIRTIDYDGTRMVVDAGGEGAVYQPRGGEWVGSAMAGGEEVKACEITGDTMQANPQHHVDAGGEKVHVKKSSVIGKMAHTAETTFEGNLFIQKHTFTATEDIDLGAFYAFIYSVAPTTTDWLLRKLDGEELAGGFKGDGGYPVDADVDWCAQYDSAAQKGLICYYITRLDPAGTTRVWDQKSYHKFFAQPFGGTMPKDTSVEYRMVMEFFSAPPDAWKDTVAQEVAGLEQRFPAEGAAQVEQPRLYDEGVPENGLLTVKAGDYTIVFAAEQAWTIDSFSFDGNAIGGATGFYGTVLVPRGGQWIGTGHTEGGREIVHAVKLLVDGQEQPIEVNKTIEADEITLIKDSTIHKFRARTTITVCKDDVYERQELEALEEMDISLMYLFMHCWSHTTTKWFAEMPDGQTTQGELVEKGFQINQDTRWIAEYEPNWGMGIIGYTPKVATGPGSATKIWVVPDRYHKHYTQCISGAGQQFKPGDKLDYEMIVKGVRAETGDWTKTLEAARALKEKYPPKQ